MVEVITGVGYQIGVEVPDMGWGSSQGWGSRQGTIKGDDGVSGMGGVTTLTGHQSGILNPLIFHLI